MKTTFIRNSFVAPHNLAFSDKVLEASRKGAKGSEMSFEYEHGAPSGPTDVLANGNMRGYIAPVDNGILPELQEFDVTASGSVDDQAIITISGGDKTYESKSGAGKSIDASIQVRGAGYHDVSVTHINANYPPNGNISYIHCTISGISGAAPVPDKNDREIACKDSCSCSIDGMGMESGGPNGSVAAGLRMASGYVSTSSGNVTQPLQWSSEYADTDLGLVYYNYRHYNPLDGRWTGRDALKSDEEYNLFCYLKNCLAYSDFLGLKNEAHCYFRQFNSSKEHIKLPKDFNKNDMKDLAADIVVEMLLKRLGGVVSEALEQTSSASLRYVRYQHVFYYCKCETNSRINEMKIHGMGIIDLYRKSVMKSEIEHFCLSKEKEFSEKCSKKTC